jgi:hypothetical protein
MANDDKPSRPVPPPPHQPPPAVPEPAPQAPPKPPAPQNVIVKGGRVPRETRIEKGDLKK